MKQVVSSAAAVVDADKIRGAGRQSAYDVEITDGEDGKTALSEASDKSTSAASRRITAFGKFYPAT